jgi:hypothetical protein
LLLLADRTFREGGRAEGSVPVKLLALMSRSERLVRVVRPGGRGPVRPGRRALPVMYGWHATRGCTLQLQNLLHVQWLCGNAVGSAYRDVAMSRYEKDGV